MGYGAGALWDLCIRSVPLLGWYSSGLVISWPQCRWRNFRGVGKPTHSNLQKTHCFSARITFYHSDVVCREIIHNICYFCVTWTTITTIKKYKKNESKRNSEAIQTTLDFICMDILIWHYHILCFYDWIISSHIYPSSSRMEDRLQDQCWHRRCVLRCVVARGGTQWWSWLQSKSWDALQQHLQGCSCRYMAGHNTGGLTLMIQWYPD